MFKKIKQFLFKNSSAKQTVAKNTFWLSVSNFGGRIIKAVIIIYAARVLGTAGYGVFSYALTLASFLTLLLPPLKVHLKKPCIQISFFIWLM